VTSPSADHDDRRNPASPRPRAMPAWIYNHPEMTRLELERVLLPSWQMLCHVSSLRHAGDYVTLDVGPESVLALRDRDGQIRAFHNVCRHRGARLLDGAGNCPGAITCPYHGWSYRHDGALLGLAARDTFPGLDKAEHGLRPVRTESAFGFVFVALAGNPPPVAQAWGSMAADFAPYRFEDMVPLGPITSETWNVDWKIAMDNYLESYHVPIGHPGLFRMFTPDYEDQAGVPGVARGVSWMRDQPSSRGSLRRTRPDRASKRPRPSHNSPSSGSPGRAARKAGGAATGRPLRWRSTRPSQSARTPSYFSLTRHNAGSTWPL